MIQQINLNPFEFILCTSYLFHPFHHETTPHPTPKSITQTQPTLPLHPTTQHPHHPPLPPQQFSNPFPSPNSPQIHLPCGRNRLIHPSHGTRGLILLLLHHHTRYLSHFLSHLPQTLMHCHHQRRKKAKQKKQVNEKH